MLEVGQRLVIKGDWDRTPTPAGRTAILLKPSFIFGLAHPTTVAVLEEMELLITGGETVLDIGTGTGILAIAAIHLGAAHVVAVDNVPEAIRALNANVALNGMQATIRVIQDTWPQPQATPVDLAIMNIDDPALIGPVMGQLDITANGTVIVVPDAEDRTPVEAAALTAGLSLVRSRPAGMYLRRPRGPVLVPDASGRMFRVPSSIQQQAEWRALVFVKARP